MGFKKNYPCSRVVVQNLKVWVPNPNMVEFGQVPFAKFKGPFILLCRIITEECPTNFE